MLIENYACTEAARQQKLSKTKKDVENRYDIDLRSKWPENLPYALFLFSIWG